MENKSNLQNANNEIFGGRPTNAMYCKTCMFAANFESIGRQPQMRYCKIYEPDDSHGKPDEVLYEGEECEYYEKEE